LTFKRELMTFKRELIKSRAWFTRRRLSVERWLLHLVRVVDKTAVVLDSLSDARQTQMPITDRQT